MALFGALCFGERLKSRVFVCIAVCSCGAVLVVRDGSGASLAGDLVAIGSAVFAGVGVNLVRSGSRTENPFMLYLGPCIFGLPLFAFVPAGGGSPDAGGAIGLLLLLGVGGMAFLAQAFMALGYRSVPAGRGSVVFYFETALTVLLGALFAGERFNLRFGLGLALILGGLALNHVRRPLWSVTMAEILKPAPNGASPRDTDVRRFDRWAPSYDASPLRKLLFEPIHARMLELLAREGLEMAKARVVDVGCGTGRLLGSVALRWPEAELFGFDPAEHMLAQAARLNPKARLALASAESLPFDDGGADVVTSSMSFHHWGDQARGIAEISRILRPGGVFCLADHSFPLARLSGEKVMSRAKLRHLMGEAGLAVLAQEGAGLPFLTISLARK